MTALSQERDGLFVQFDGKHERVIKDGQESNQGF
jgi:hypothetical protein